MSLKEVSVRGIGLDVCPGDTSSILKVKTTALNNKRGLKDFVYLAMTARRAY